MYSVADVEKFVVTDLPEDVMALSAVKYVPYVLCAVMASACISNSGYILW